jgi:hypothetical protein
MDFLCRYQSSTNPITTKQNQKSTTNPKSNPALLWRAAGGRNREQARYIAFPINTAASDLQKFPATIIYLDTDGRGKVGGPGGTGRAEGKTGSVTRGVCEARCEASCDTMARTWRSCIQKFNS